MHCMFAELIPESSYGTPMADPVRGTDTVVLELLDDDPVTVETNPNNEQLYSWLACGEADRAIGETYGISGTIRTLLYPSQAALLLGWAFRPVSDQGGDPGDEVPWPTAEPAGQLASMAMDFAYRDDAGNERKNRFLGGKVTGVTLSADRGTRDGAFVLELETAWSQRTSTTATAPAANLYPNAAPYFLSATSGNVTINGVTIADYDQLSIEGSYTAPIRFDEDPVIKRIRHHRRDYTLNLRSLLKFDPDWRALRDNRSTFAASALLEYPGGAGQQAITFAFGANSRVNNDGWSKALPITGDRTQQLVIMSQLDRSTGRTMGVEIGVQT